MNNQTKELAEQAGLPYVKYISDEQMKLVERLAALIRHDEAKACAEHYLPIMRDAVEQAVLKEREACAKLCEEENWSYAMGNIIRSERGVA